MPRSFAFPIVLVLTLFATGCSRSSSQSAASSSSSTTAPATATASAGDDGTGPPLDCAKVFAPSDAQGILTAAATVKPYVTRDRSCRFETAGDAAINIYADYGTTSEVVWTAATTSSDRSKYAPLPGVGDEAFYQVDNGTSVISKKGDAYCTVVFFAGGEGESTSDRGIVLAKKLGALCVKEFAAG